MCFFGWGSDLVLFEFYQVRYSVSRIRKSTFSKSIDPQ